MAYADFPFYVETYKGTTVPEDSFPSFSERASEYIDQDTFGLAAGAADGAREAVQRCCCAMTEILYADQQTPAGASAGAVLKAETVGSWRREYELTAEATKTIAQRLYDVERRYLAPWGLLYRGVRPCVH